MGDELQLVMVDPRPALCQAFDAAFTDLPNVEIFLGKFEELAAFDCMVSAANSFGLMDGGVDAAIIEFFGTALMDRVQARILDQFCGEQPVGSAMIVETHHPDHPYIAHAPTMRVPMTISESENVYLAMWSVLLAVRAHNRDAVGPLIRRVACPGLGTGVGRMDLTEAARQMALAYSNFLNPPEALTWDVAWDRHMQLQARTLPADFGKSPGASTDM